jgi:SecY interacting protein Syd
MNQKLNNAMDDFILRYVCAAQDTTQGLKIEYDPNWPSSCYEQTGELDELVAWSPNLRLEQGQFVGLEEGLEMTIHPDVVTFYGRYWSENLCAETDQGQLQLLQAWNEQDYQRLQQNIVGHVLMKRRLKQAESVFIALTDEEDFILSVENSSGRVMLEQVGLASQNCVAEDLASFINSLKPLIIPN